MKSAQRRGGCDFTLPSTPARVLVPPGNGNTIRNPNSRLNQEIEEEVGAFTARTKQQPTDDEFLELENAIRELRAKYIKNGRGSETGSRGGDGSGGRGSAASGRASGTRGSSKRGVSGTYCSISVQL